MRHLNLLLIALLLVTSFNLARPAAPARAASTITVTTENDDTANNGLCSLREAIANANDDAATFTDCVAGSGNDTIKFSSGMTGAAGNILLGSALPILSDTDGVSIDGSGAKVVVNGQDTFRVFEVATGVSATVKNLTLSDGSGPAASIYNAGTLILQNSTLTSGGGIYNDLGVATVTNSTFTGNSAADGSAVYNNGGAVTITHATIYDNAATGGAILYNGGTMTVKNTILAEGNSSFLCLGNALESASTNNLADDASCGASFTVTTVGALALGPLADYGGSTPTISLLEGSVAFNAANTASCPSTDQRGSTRPQPTGSLCDVGSFEIKVALGYSPASLAFGDMIAGIASQPKTVTITNNSEMNVSVTGLTIVEAVGGVTVPSDDFFINSNTCVAPIPPAGTCAFTVIFFPPPVPPMSIGTKSGTARIYTSISANPFTVSLTGNSILGTNLLLSPNFDAITKPIPWKSPSPSYTLFSVLDCTIFYSPLCSVHFTGSPQNKSYLIYQSLLRGGKAGDRYLFRMSSLADSIPPGGSYKVELVFQNNRNRPIATFYLLFTEGTHDWEHLQNIATAPSVYYTMVYRIVFQKTGGQAWFDNAGLVKLP
jgi:CSLREA domain-containing protein